MARQPGLGGAQEPKRPCIRHGRTASRLSQRPRKHVLSCTSRISSDSKTYGKRQIGSTLTQLAARPNHSRKNRQAQHPALHYMTAMCLSSVDNSPPHCCCCATSTSPHLPQTARYTGPASRGNYRTHSDVVCMRTDRTTSAKDQPPYMAVPRVVWPGQGHVDSSMRRTCDDHD